MKFEVEVTYEWRKTYRLPAESEEDAERLARLQAKEDLVDQIEEQSVSVSEFETAIL